MKLNLRGGWAVIRSQLFAFTSTKGFFWTLAIGWMTGPVIYLLVWAAASREGAIGGYERNDFILYYLILLIVNQLTYPTTHWSTAESILNGDISKAMLRPMPVVYDAFGCDLATKIVCVPFVAAVSAALGIFLRAEITLAAQAVLPGILSLLLALALRFVLAHILSLLSFWGQRSSALLNVNDTFVFLFAGQVAPIAVFPAAMKALAVILPYRYMISFPVELMLGKLSPQEILFGFAMQAAWAAVLLAADALVGRAGTKRYSATGG